MDPLKKMTDKAHYVFDRPVASLQTPSLKINVKLKFTTMKKTNANVISLFMGLLFTFFVSYAQAQETQVKVTGIRSGKGKIILNVFRDNETYEHDQPYKKFVFDKKTLVNGMLTLNCDLAPAIYAITPP